MRIITRRDQILAAYVGYKANAEDKGITASFGVDPHSCSLEELIRAANPGFSRKWEIYREMDYHALTCEECLKEDCDSLVYVGQPRTEEDYHSSEIGLCKECIEKLAKLVM